MSLINTLRTSAKDLGTLAENEPPQKDNALARCRIGQRAWRAKGPMLYLNAVTDEEGPPLENEDESGRRLCEYCGLTFQARAEGPRHHQFENLLQHVQKAPDDVRWVIDRTEFDELIAMKKDSAPCPDGIPYGAYRCAGGLGTHFLFQRLQMSVGWKYRSRTFRWE